MIGETGTLVMPTFNVTGGMLQQISSGVPFDREQTPTTLGIISEVFKRMGEKVRVGEPLVKVKPNPTLFDSFDSESSIGFTIKMKGQESHASRSGKGTASCR